jgi:hypothetical protein
MRVGFLAAVLLLVVRLALAAPHAGARRVACDQVISAVNRAVRFRHGQAADMSVLARHLGTSVPWVERCMQMYGRRPKRPGSEAAESKEAQIEAFEEDEPEESASEDNEEPGASERVIHPQKPRVFRLQPPPTPKEGQESRDGFGK